MTTEAAPVSSGRPRLLDEEGRLALNLHVNGQDHRVKARPHSTLIEVLRGELKLIGVREACGVGMCGSCTVLVDGRPMSGCLMLAFRAEGHDLVTIEGLGEPGGAPDPIQQAYVDHTAFQCSYCTPGFILTTKALLTEIPDADRDQARRYLAGNLCRCGSYVKILDAVMDAQARVRAD